MLAAPNDPSASPKPALRAAAAAQPQGADKFATKPAMLAATVDGLTSTIVKNAGSNERCLLQQCELFGLSEQERAGIEKDFVAIRGMAGQHDGVLAYLEAGFLTESVFSITTAFLGAGTLADLVTCARGGLAVDLDSLPCLDVGGGGGGGGDGDGGKAEPPHLLDVATVCRLASDVAAGLAFVHDKGVVHGDIQMEHLFLDEGGRVKIGGFRVGHKAAPCLKTVKTATPAMHNMAPEVWQHQVYSYGSDMWSVGCVLYELLCLRHPFPADSCWGLKEDVVGINFDRDLVRVRDCRLADLALELLSAKISTRPSAQDMVQLCRQGTQPRPKPVATEEGPTVDEAFWTGIQKAMADAGWTGRTLHFAARHNNTDLCTKLLVEGADVDEARGDSATALHLAAVRNSAGVASLMLLHGADINCRDKDARTPLHRAAKKNSQDVAAILVMPPAGGGRAANLEARDKLRPVDAKKSDFLRRRDDRFRPRQATALLRAVFNGSYDVLSILVDCGADINAHDEVGRTALHLISQSATRFAFESAFCPEFSEDYHSDCENDCLSEARFNAALRCTPVLLDAGAAVNAVDKTGASALHYAAKAWAWELVETLVQRGANPNLADSDLNTPLHMIAQRDFIAADMTPEEEAMAAAMVAALLQAGANPTARNKQKATPMHTLASFGPACVELLIKHGADVNALDKSRRSPLHLSTRSQEVALLLIEHGADVDHCETNGETPLHVFAKANREVVVRSLLSHNADLTRKAGPLASLGMGSTPAEAAGRASPELALLLNSVENHRETRVAFVGAHGSGKTVLCTAFRQRSSKRRSSALGLPTEGIAISNHACGQPEVQFDLWDFGFQPKYFDLHTRLLPSMARTAFVVTVKVTSYDACRSRQVTQEVSHWLNLLVQHAPIRSEASISPQAGRRTSVLLVFTHRDEVTSPAEEVQVLTVLRALAAEAKATYGQVLNFVDLPNAEAALWVCATKWRHNAEAVVRATEDLGIHAMHQHRNVLPRMYRVARAHLRTRRDAMAAKHMLARCMPSDAFRAELRKDCTEAGQDGATAEEAVDATLAALLQFGHLLELGPADGDEGGQASVWLDPVQLLARVLPRLTGPDDLESVVIRSGRYHGSCVDATGIEVLMPPEGEAAYPADWASLFLWAGERFGLCMQVPPAWDPLGFERRRSSGSGEFCDAAAATDTSIASASSSGSGGANTSATAGAPRKPRYLFWSMLPRLTDLDPDTVADLRSDMSDPARPAALGVKLNCRAPATFPRSVLPGLVERLGPEVAVAPPELWDQGFQMRLDARVVAGEGFVPEPEDGAAVVLRVLSDVSLHALSSARGFPEMPTTLQVHVSAASEALCHRGIAFLEEQLLSAVSALARPPAWLKEPEPSFRLQNWPATFALEASFQQQLEASQILPSQPAV